MTPSTRTTPDNDLPDAALAERAAAGDEGAFEALDRRYRLTLLCHCNRILRNGHDAEEAVQGALLRAYRALSAGRRPASLLPWLLAIARNECMDVLRARRDTQELPPDVESRGVRPDELVVRREEARVLYADLRELPEAQREALILRSMGDLPHGEIARLLNRTAADARTLCREARLSLAECHEGRDLECAAVRERIDSGDGRALRARRIRAHLRACGGCRDAADGIRTPGRSGLGALFPLPWLSAIRSPLSGGLPTAAAGGAARPSSWVSRSPPPSRRSSWVSPCRQERRRTAPPHPRRWRRGPSGRHRRRRPARHPLRRRPSHAPRGRRPRHRGGPRTQRGPRSPPRRRRRRRPRRARPR